MRSQERIQLLLCVVALLSTWAACGFQEFQETELTGLPIEVSQADAQDVNIDIVLKNVQEQVQVILPEAYLSMFIFAGRCQELSELRGQVYLEFLQVKSFLFYRRVLGALVAVDTIQGTMELRTVDLSGGYWLTDPLPPQSVSVAGEIADVASKHIADLGIWDCDITLECKGRTWYVLCTEPGSGPFGSRLCEFEIDASTKQIVPVKQDVLP